MTRVPVRNPRQTGHNVLQTLRGIAHGQIQQHPRTRSDPQQVFAGQQGGDPEARRFVLTNNVVARGQHLVHRVAHVDLKEQLVAAKERVRVSHQMTANGGRPLPLTPWNGNT